jgi:hypothetical protein
MAVKKVTPDADFSRKSFTFQGETYVVREKFKVGRFLKSLAEAPVDAIELVLEEDSFERFLDLEISMDELKEFLEGLSNALSGSDSKN